MSLPINVIDRLFQRLAATYGASWDRSMGQTPIGDVKAAWCHELQGFSRNLDAIAWALENLPEKCPNVIEFRNLARKAPEPVTPRLPEPPADPQRLKAEIAKLQPIIEATKKASRDDGLAWARRIVASADGGLPIAPATLKMAKDALSRKAVMA